MKPYLFLIIFFALIKVNDCSAQVYVFAREDKAEIVQNTNIEDGGSKILRQVADKEGKWISLLETDTIGYGAVFCVATPEGLSPKYYVSKGKSTSAEAIEEARSKAQDYSKGKSSVKVFIMRAFNNQNKYPLIRTKPE